MAGRIAAGFAAFALLLSGCTFSDGYGVTIHKEEQETEYSSVYAEIAEFSGFEDKEFQSNMNMELRREAENAISEFDAVAQESKLPSGVKSVLRISQDIKRNSGGIVSFVTEEYIYTGGAHGSTLWNPRTVVTDENGMHQEELSGLFNTVDYIKVINDCIDELVEKNPERYSELWAEPHISKKTADRFYLTDSDLVIFFPPYELSYYAKGFVEFSVPFERINAYLAERYRVE